MENHRLIKVAIVGGKLKEDKLAQKISAAEEEGYEVRESIIAGSRTTHLVMVKD